jgi:hypothetical protein
MTSSFRKINYSLRPAKHAERRMLCEVFGRLRPFQSISDYTYVGFGSVWFADFVLFHRALGIRDMLSIERVAEARQRIEANKPYRSIVVSYKDSSRVLPKLSWEKRHLIWLDYDEPLTVAMLRDVTTVCARARSGSVLAVSVPCHAAREIDAAEEEAHGPSSIERFQQTFGRERLSQDVSEIDLQGWPFAALSRRILFSEIEQSLAVRNALIPDPEKMSFRTICEIEYEDGVKMTTVVGIFTSEADTPIFEACKFDSLDFMPARGSKIRIRIPKLTVREIRTLEQQLPRLPKKALSRGSIPAAEAKAFADLYRYLPNFAILES